MYVLVSHVELSSYLTHNMAHKYMYLIHIENQGQSLLIILMHSVCVSHELITGSIPTSINTDNKNYLFYKVTQQP